MTTTCAVCQARRVVMVFQPFRCHCCATDMKIANSTIAAAILLPLSVIAVAVLAKPWIGIGGTVLP